jgi:hypothetical protein
VPVVLLIMTSLCRVFYWKWKVCAGCFIEYDKSVLRVLLAMTIPAGCFIGMTRQRPVLYWV